MEDAELAEDGLAAKTEGRSPGLSWKWHSDARLLSVTHIFLAKCFVRLKYILGLRQIFLE